MQGVDPSVKTLSELQRKVAMQADRVLRHPVKVRLLRSSGTEQAAQVRF